MNPPTEQLIRDYLNRVSLAARGRLEADERRAFLARTREFIEQNTRALGKTDWAGVSQLLSSVGDPAALVGRECDRLASGRLAGNPAQDPAVFLTDSSAEARGPRPTRARRWRLSRGTLAGLMTSSATAVPPGTELPVPEPAADAAAPPAASAGPPKVSPAAGSKPRTQRPQWPWLDAGQPAGNGTPVNGTAPAATANRTPANETANGSSADGLLPGEDIPGENMSPSGTFPSRTAGKHPASPGGTFPNGTSANVTQPGGARATGAQPNGTDGTGTRPGGAGNARSRRVRTGRAVGSVADVVRGTGWARGVRYWSTEPGGPGGDRRGGPGRRGTRPVWPPRRDPVSSDSAAGEEPFGEPGLGLGLPPGSLAAAPERAGKLIRAAATWARRRPLETTAVVLLGLGGLIFPPVWLLGALVALASRVWDHRDKWVGLVLPVFLVVAGMAAAVSLGGPHHGVSGYAREAWLAGDHLSRIVAVLGAAYLAWRAERGRRRPAIPPWTKGGRLG